MSLMRPPPGGPPAAKGPPPSGPPSSKGLPPGGPPSSKGLPAGGPPTGPPPAGGPPLAGPPGKHTSFKGAAAAAIAVRPPPPSRDGPRAPTEDATVRAVCVSSQWKATLALGCLRSVRRFLFLRFWQKWLRFTLKRATQKKIAAHLYLASRERVRRGVYSTWLFFASLKASAPENAAARPWSGCARLQRRLLAPWSYAGDGPSFSARRGVPAAWPATDGRGPYESDQWRAGAAPQNTTNYNNNASGSRAINVSPLPPFENSPAAQQRTQAPLRGQQAQFAHTPTDRVLVPLSSPSHHGYPAQAISPLLASPYPQWTHSGVTYEALTPPSAFRRTFPPRPLGPSGPLVAFDGELFIDVGADTVHTY